MVGLTTNLFLLARRLTPYPLGLCTAEDKEEKNVLTVLVSLVTEKEGEEEGGWW